MARSQSLTTAGTARSECQTEEPACRLCHCLLATCGASRIWPMATWIDDTRYSLSFFLGLEGQKKRKRQKKGKLQKNIHALFVLHQKKAVGGVRGVYENPKKKNYSSTCAFFSRLRGACFFQNLCVYLFYFSQLLLIVF
ncbi:hypothetical protein VPH35_033827 [Triticum aestivum]